MSRDTRIERRAVPRDSHEAGTVADRREVVLITGISGSGKSVALHALEDAGFFCVDNLPPEMLREFIRLEHGRLTHRVAVAVDVRNATDRVYAANVGSQAYLGAPRTADVTLHVAF